MPNIRTKSRLLISVLELHMFESVFFVTGPQLFYFSLKSLFVIGYCERVLNRLE